MNSNILFMFLKQDYWKYISKLLSNVLIRPEIGFEYLQTMLKWHTHALV